MVQPAGKLSLKSSDEYQWFAMCMCRPAQPSRSVDPDVREQRSLRWEQDRDYEESLAADRCVLVVDSTTSPQMIMYIPV